MHLPRMTSRNMKADERGTRIDLMATAKPYHIYPGEQHRPTLPRIDVPGFQSLISRLLGFSFVGYPNRDSTPYKERYNIPEAQTIVRYVGVRAW